MRHLVYHNAELSNLSAQQDTTAGAISSAIYFLARHPEIQRTVREEVLEVIGDDEPQTEHYLRTPYLNAVIRESMRSNSPGTVTLPRISDRPVQIGSYPIPPNTPMMLNITAAHHNEVIWNEPSAFDPRRFLGEAKQELENWVTFGIGPRKCLARNFSMYEQRVLVSMLARKYRWKLPEDSAHRDHVRNGFQAFALSLPEKLYIDFESIEGKAR